jgi:hypothetical protein
LMPRQLKTYTFGLLRSGQVASGPGAFHGCA